MGVVAMSGVEADWKFISITECVHYGGQNQAGTFFVFRRAVRTRRKEKDFSEIPVCKKITDNIRTSTSAHAMTQNEMD